MIRMYKEKIINALTGEETLRDYTEAEIAELEAEKTAKAEAEAAEAEAKAEADAAKAALLEKLGITEDEAKLLLS